MFHPLKVILPAAAALCLSASAFADGPTWFADYDAAAAEAAKTGKDMLVDFTGSDWCYWCKKLDAEVYELEAFQKGVENDYILVALDFPNDEAVKAKVPNPARNTELMEQNNVTGFPTILLMTSKGEVYARTGYQEGGPEKYLEHLAALRTSGKRALEQVGTLVAEFNAAEGPAKLEAWDKLADLADTLDGQSPFAARLVDPLKLAFSADPANEQGRKLRAVKTLFALDQTDAEVLALATELDPANANGLLELSVASHFSGVRDDVGARAAIAALTEFEAKAKFTNTQLAAQLYANVAMWLAGPLEEPEAGKPWAQKALDLKPQDEQMVTALEGIVAGS